MKKTLQHNRYKRYVPIYMVGIVLAMPLALHAYEEMSLRDDPTTSATDSAIDDYRKRGMLDRAKDWADRTFRKKAATSDLQDTLTKLADAHKQTTDIQNFAYNSTADEWSMKYPKQTKRQVLDSIDKQIQSLTYDAARKTINLAPSQAREAIISPKAANASHVVSSGLNTLAYDTDIIGTDAQALERKTRLEHVHRSITAVLNSAGM